MRHKILRQISVRTTPEAEDAVAELLGSLLNLPASTYHDLERGVSTVTVFLPETWKFLTGIRGEIGLGLKRMKGFGLKIGAGTIVMSRVPRKNWAESWKRHFSPIEIGDALLIKPSWSKRRPRKGQAVIILDPGLSFGTGHHPTTAFCLGETVRLKCPVGSSIHAGGAARRRGKARSFLDIGTGSGILAIAAAKMGYSPVRALDFDPDAIRVARANARINGVHEELEIRRREVAELPLCPGRRGQHDFICANLIADLLIKERRRIAAQLKPSGTLVLAGILGKEFQKVRAAYEDLGLKMRACRREKEWCSASFGL